MTNYTFKIYPKFISLWVTWLDLCNRCLTELSASHLSPLTIFTRLEMLQNITFFHVILCQYISLSPGTSLNYCSYSLFLISLPYSIYIIIIHSTLTTLVFFLIASDTQSLFHLRPFADCHLFVWKVLLRDIHEASSPASVRFVFIFSLKPCI